MSTLPQVHDDRNLNGHWLWMLGNETEGTDTQPDGERWAIVPAPLSPESRFTIMPAPAPKYHEPTDDEAFNLLIEFSVERCEERTALLVKQPPVYEPIDLDDAEEFMVTADDLAYQCGYACGYDGHLASAPSGLSEDEFMAWTEGWTEGYYTHINELERDYVLGHPDPDPWNEAHSPLAGHPSQE